MIADRSRKALAGIHPDLVRVLERADANGVEFVVVCGRRTLAEQKTLVATGKSKTLHSRHLTGHAVDLVDTGFTWSEPAMLGISAGIKQAAVDVGVPVEWGGDWKSFIDTPHFQLPRAVYPDDDQESHKPNSVTDNRIREPVPAGPLRRSGTAWGIFIGAFEAITGSLEKWLGVLTDAATKFNDLQPVHGMLSQAGANSKAISLGLIASALTYALSRRVKAGQEGKAG